MFKITKPHAGFTLVELIVVMSVIGILSSIVYANFGSARAASRDDVRKAALKEVQLALELYKAQNGVYPAQGCSTWTTHWAGPGPQVAWGCESETYIVDLVPDFIAALPKDPTLEYTNGWGFAYRSNGTDYKLIVHGSVERKLITSYSDEFARCPAMGGGCPGTVPVPTIYAVYSPGAAQW